MSKQSQSGRSYPKEFREKAGRLNTIHADCKQAMIKNMMRKKYCVRTTDAHHQLPIVENVLNRNSQHKYLAVK